MGGEREFGWKGKPKGTFFGGGARGICFWREPLFVAFKGSQMETNDFAGAPNRMGAWAGHGAESRMVPGGDFHFAALGALARGERLFPTARAGTSEQWIWQKAETNILIRPYPDLGSFCTSLRIRDSL